MSNQVDRERQLEFEREGIDLGIKRYRESLLTTNLSDLPPGVALLRLCMEPVVKMVEEHFKTKSKANPETYAQRRFLDSLSSEVIAYIVAKRVLNALTELEDDPDSASLSAVSLQRVGVTLVKMLEEEIEYRQLKKLHGGYLHVVEENLKSTNFTYRRRVIEHIKKKLGGIEGPKESDTNRAKLGAKLILMFKEATGLITLVQPRHDETYYIEPTKDCLEWIEKANGRCELLSPFYFPMVIQPKDWFCPEGGGLLITTLKMVKTDLVEHQKLLADHAMPGVYDALNTLQRTKWRINKNVYRVFNDTWAEGTGIGQLPLADEEPLPAKMWADDETPDPVLLTEWKRAATQVYDRRARTRSKRLAVEMKRYIAREMLNESELYFVWTMDWRGRVYPLQPYLNPQSDDLGRALLEFADGKELGEHGAFWLAVHGANCYGIDKASYADRVEWVQNNRENIVRSAESPVDFRWWEDAENPYQFLAFCMEWARVPDIDAHKFVSHLPVQLDGTCNGLQHFSALLLDPVGAAATNLLPADRPADIYQQVADELSKLVDVDVLNGNETAKLWQGKITRKITKRGVMTTPYGVTPIGLKLQLEDEVRKIDKFYLGEGVDMHEACRYLALQLPVAIGRIVKSAQEAMSWLQAVAAVCNDAKAPIVWTTPVGYIGRHEYLRTNLQRVETYFGSIRYQLGLREWTTRLNKVKQKNGISPNFIHSVDAAHLMLTVVALRDAGIKDFAMIHDSYGTHAGNVPVLNKLLREVFIDIYSEDLLERFREEVASQLPKEFADKLPPAPKRGSLNLNLVNRAQYFFA